MRITAGTTNLNTLGIFGETITYNDSPVQSIKLILGEDITQEQIDELLQNDWQIVDDDGNVMSTQQGYNTLYQYAITFLKVPDLAKENETLKAQVAELQAALAGLQTKE